MVNLVIQQILPLIAGGALGGGICVYFLREWIVQRLRAGIQDEYNRKLEVYKRELELHFNDEVRRRRLYEELAMSIEDIFASMPDTDSRTLTAKINKLFALLALYAPDDVYRRLKATFYAPGHLTVYAKDARPVVYHALRAALFGKGTQLAAEDLVDNIECTPVLRNAGNESGAL